MVVSLSDVYREKDSIYFTYYSNANMDALCRLMTPKGVPVKSVRFGNERRQRGVFSDVDPRKAYKLQCMIGESITENSGIFRGHSEAVTIPRDTHDVVKTIVIIVSVILFVVFGICGLIIMFKFPEFFDIFFPSFVLSFLFIVGRVPVSLRSRACYRRTMYARTPTLSLSPFLSSGYVRCVILRTAQRPALALSATSPELLRRVS